MQNQSYSHDINKIRSKDERNMKESCYKDLYNHKLFWLKCISGY